MRIFRQTTIAVLWVLCLGPAAEAATVENLTYNLGGVRFVLPRIETTGGTTTDADLRAATDPAGSDTLAQRLARLNATTITIPELRIESAADAPRTLFTYRDIRLNNVGNGMIDAVNIGSAVADMVNPKGMRIQANYGAMTARKLNLGLILRIVTTRRTDPNEPMQTVYEDFTAEGMQMTSDEVDATMGRMTGGPVKARTLATPISDIIQIAQTSQGGPPSTEDQRKIFAMASDVLANIDLGQAEVRDIKFTIKKDKPGAFSIGRIFMGGIAKAKFGEIAYEDMRITMPDGRISFGRIALRDFDMTRTMAALADAASSGDLDLKGRDPRDVLPTLGLIQIQGVDADLPDATGTGNSPDGKRILMTLGRFELAMRNFIDGVPSAVFATLQNLTLPLPQHPADKNLQQFVDLGMNKIDLSTGLDVAWNEATQEIAINDVSMTMPGLGALKIKGRLGNATKDLFSSNVALVQATALGVVAKSLEIKFDNAGGVEKALALQAKRAGQTVQQVKQMLIAGAAIGIPAILGNHPAARTVASALTKFLAEPKSLSIAARAPAGLGIADVAGVSDPQAILQKLDVSAEANR